MSTGGPTARHVTKKNNFAYLAVALIGLLFCLALSHEFGIVLGEIAVEAALITALAAGVWSVRGDYRLHTTRLSLLAAVLLLFAVRLWVTRAGLDFVWLGIVTVWAACSRIGKNEGIQDDLSSQHSCSQLCWRLGAFPRPCPVSDRGYGKRRNPSGADRYLEPAGNAG